MDMDEVDKMKDLVNFGETSAMQTAINDVATWLQQQW